MRGLKLARNTIEHCSGSVAPYTGAWIEILAYERFDSNASVAPYTGAWIEIRSANVYES